MREPTFAHYKDKCICCEQSGKVMNKEHIFPLWLLERTNCKKDLFRSPYGRITADKKNLKRCVDWSKIDKTEYRDAMRESVDNSHRIFELLKSALTDDIYNREIIMKGIDYSYYYETDD